MQNNRLTWVNILVVVQKDGWWPVPVSPSVFVPCLLKLGCWLSVGAISIADRKRTRRRRRRVFSLMLCLYSITRLTSLRWKTSCHRYGCPWTTTNKHYTLKVSQSVPEVWNCGCMFTKTVPSKGQSNSSESTDQFKTYLLKLLFGCH